MTPEFRWPAAIRDLRTAVQFDLLRSGYTGILSYENGEVQYGQYAPFPHRLSFEFTATPSSVSLEPLALAVRSSTISLRAKVTNYRQPKVDGTYDIHIHARGFQLPVPGRRSWGRGSTLRRHPLRDPVCRRDDSGPLARGPAGERWSSRPPRERQR